MKPPFSYYGGKRRIASKIAPIINNIPHKIYVEPFCGAATILFAKDWIIPGNRDNYREVINDHNSLIFNFFEVLKSDKFCHLERLIEYTLYSQKEYEKAESILFVNKTEDKILKAWAFFVMINMSFSNNLKKRWFKRGKQGRNDPIVWQNKKAHLSNIVDRLADVYVTEEDSFDCIQQWDSRDTLFYLDPPYPNCDQGHYSGYSQKDFERLIECLSNIQGSFVLSNYDNAAVPKQWQRVDIPSFVSAAGSSQKRHSTECLWIVSHSYENLPLFANY